MNEWIIGGGGGFFETRFLCSSGGPRIYFVEQTGLPRTHKDVPVSVSKCLGERCIPLTTTSVLPVKNMAVHMVIVIKCSKALAFRMISGEIHI